VGTKAVAEILLPPVFYADGSQTCREASMNGPMRPQERRSPVGKTPGADAFAQRIVSNHIAKTRCVTHGDRSGRSCPEVRLDSCLRGKAVESERNVLLV
jgi:hypothetical protein